jgi:hypothetical protein
MRERLRERYENRDAGYAGQAVRNRIVILAALLVGAWLAIPVSKWVRVQRETANLNNCIANMKQLDGAAMSLCLENKYSYSQVISLEQAATFLRNEEAPLCPLGSAPYRSFDVLHGPRCPNSEEHNRAWVVGNCRAARATIWSAALCYAAANGLSWSDSVDPRVIEIGFYSGKATGVCPIAAKAYPPFLLKEGPRCSVSAEHNAANARPYRNGEYFDENGHARTNLPLAKVSTNQWSDWRERL